MNRFIYILLFLITANFLNAKDAQKLVWPYPPDEAKIEYVTMIKNSKDLGIEKGFFTKAFNFLFGEDEKSFTSPFGLHVDKERVYVTDVVTKQLKIFDKKKNKVIVVDGSDDEAFMYPLDVVTDKSGNIYVSDSIRAKVFVFEDDGDFSHIIAPRELQRPVGLAISHDGERLYIVDAVSSKIHMTTLKGKYLGAIGKKGNGDAEFNRPTFMEVGSNGNLYVSDSMNHRIQILDKDGKFIGKFGQLGQEIGSFGSPRGISVDGEENIYVSDTMFNVIQVFNQKGELLLVFGSFGGKRGEFALAEDISITDDNMIYIADTNNKRVQLFKFLDSSGTRSIR